MARRKSKVAKVVPAVIPTAALTPAELRSHGRLAHERPDPKLLSRTVKALLAKRQTVEDIARICDLPLETIEQIVAELTPKKTPPKKLRRKSVTSLTEKDLAQAERRRERERNARDRKALRQENAALFTHLPAGRSFLTPPPELEEHPVVLEERRLAAVALAESSRR